jgi:hypothetical protein
MDVSTVGLFNRDSGFCILWWSPCVLLFVYVIKCSGKLYFFVWRGCTNITLYNLSISYNITDVCGLNHSSIHITVAHNDNLFASKSSLLLKRVG